MLDNDDHDNNQQTKFSLKIQQIETELAQRVTVYGNEDLTALKLYHQLCRLLNHSAIAALQNNKLDTCIQFLKRAESIVIYVPDEKVQTYNNLACYYRKVGKIRTALKYLQDALQIELQQKQTLNRLNTQINLSDTYLNLCAVLSQLDRHEEAIQHIYLSIIMLQHELLMQTLNIDKRPSNASSRQSTIQQAMASTNSLQIQERKTQERISVLVVAYHNLGVEMEYLNRKLESVKIFNSALQLAEQNLPTNHKMLETLKSITKTTKECDIDLKLKPNLPKVNNKKQQLKQIYKQISPQDSSLLRSIDIYSDKTRKLTSRSFDFKYQSRTLDMQRRQNKQIDDKLEKQRTLSLHQQEYSMKVKLNTGNENQDLNTLQTTPNANILKLQGQLLGLKENYTIV